ncbi:XdhC family protein [Halorarius litoreus]|uniref:XdhC family protein n=1 Tax=Halorarius litoreus TaxID=2962676 RepID=UPI0020CE74BD|nr:XdhC/CoxI family protein [Halorarius litoreus]
MSQQNWSVPEQDVRERIRGLLADEDGNGVLATVVGVRGSAYRRPGARMVITQDDSFGNVTAGCLEDEVRQLAADVVAAGEPRVETYDLMEDDDDIWGLGVGCNGVIDILLEPLTGVERPLFPDGDRLASLVLLDGDGPRFATGQYDPESGFAGDLPSWVERGAEADVRTLLEAGKSRTISVTADGKEADLFVEALVPSPKLVVLGTGPDVGPVVELAKNVDFEVTVIGFRGGNARAERFPRADNVLSTSPAQLADAHDFDDSTYVVTMTHNFVDDRLSLDALLDTDVPYIGLLGPRKRFEEMQEAFADEGRTFSQAELDRIQTPVGLDLGSGTPYGIAHSIVAELLAVHNDREPAHLEEREGPIHPRVVAGND